MALAGLFFGFGPAAQAAEVTRVASSFDEDDKFDLHFGVGYDFEFKKAAILREWSNGATNRLARDLLYQQMRHTVTPTLEIGLYRDLAVYVGIPIIASDTRNYAFDQEASPCVYGDEVTPPEEATCVNHGNSTSIRDGIIPRNGFDATNTDDPYNQFGGDDTQKIFQAPTRFGVDQLWVGVKYGILNQDRLSHMPTWLIALEGRFAVGRPMTFSRDITQEDPSGNHTVGRGMHELGVWTALSRRYRFLNPFFMASWRQAISAGGNSLFINHGGTQNKVNPQSEISVIFGSEIVPFERKAKEQKFAIELSGRARLLYGGRGYSEAWELFADSPALVGNYTPGQSGACNRASVVSYAAANPEDANYIEGAGAGPGCQPFNGVTDIQDYAIFGLRAGLNAHLNKYARLSVGVDISTNTRHFITNASRGADENDNDLVDPNSTEVNPVRRDVIDNVGRRYLVDDVLSVVPYFRFMVTF
ncbi:MAG: hypothetical protein R3A51_23360 [Nannocystaceae bacterium]|nr:hypothetical protein [Myxococcales bacterium]